MRRSTKTYKSDPGLPTPPVPKSKSPGRCRGAAGIPWPLIAAGSGLAGIGIGYAATRKSATEAERLKMLAESLSVMRNVQKTIDDRAINMELFPAGVVNLIEVMDALEGIIISTGKAGNDLKDVPVFTREINTSANLFIYNPDDLNKAALDYVSRIMTSAANNPSNKMLAMINGAIENVNNGPAINPNFVNPETDNKHSKSAWVIPRLLRPGPKTESSFGRRKSRKTRKTRKSRKSRGPRKSRKSRKTLGSR